MTVATVTSTVGIRDLKNGLSAHIARVRDGAEIIVTDHGRPVARVSPIDAPLDRLGDLVADGLVRAPRAANRPEPRRRIEAAGPVSDLIAEQRR